MDKQFLLSFYNGNASKLARALGITQASVAGWGDVVPFSAIGRVAVYQPKIMRAYWRDQRKEK